MEKSPKVAVKFSCQHCDYNCTKKSDYGKHIMTAKHKNRTKTNVLEQKVAETRRDFVCKTCNKIYKARNSLWYHEKGCKEIKNEKEENNSYDDFTVNSDFPTDKQLIMMLIKDNSELKNMMMKVIENGTTNNTTNNTNSHNKAFNLNFFLNETCKDAMNIMDFVDSIKLQLSDLERVGECGFVDGISNIIVKNLKALDITERPIHCTDKKREVLYVKNENKWEKDEEKNKIKKVIKRVANKNIHLLPAFKEKYPDCNNSSSKHSDRYNKIIVESMDTDGENEDKIIKNISKEVVVDKEF